jgi:hypothetical protein
MYHSIHQRVHNDMLELHEDRQDLLEVDYRPGIVQNIVVDAFPGDCY